MTLAWNYKTEKYQGTDSTARISVNAARILRANGMTFVGRYLGGSYALTKDEVNAIHSAGLHLFVCFERGSGDVKQGGLKGTIQGKEALVNAKELGLPRGCCIYFACDEQATTSAEFERIYDYLQKAKAALGGEYLCGIYGSYYVVEQMYMRRACDRYCQCTAWSWQSGRQLVSEHLNLFQYSGEESIEAIAVKRKVGFNVDLVFCPNIYDAGMWLASGVSSNSSVTSVTDYVYGPAQAISGNVFVPRTVAPLADEEWWKIGKNPCIARYNGTVLPNCFVGSTEIITNKGVLTLKKAHDWCKKGRKLDVPTIDGDWHEADVKYFGKQRIYKVRFQSSTYYCTANHRWLIQTKKGIRPVSTLELNHNMRIPYRMCNTEPFTRLVSVEDTGREERVYCAVEPVTRSFTLAGGEITGNCVGYAHGRFCEILGYFYPGLPRCNGGDWIDAIRNNGVNLEIGQEPQIGAVMVWKKANSAGHVCIVEYVNSDGSVWTSESGYNCSWNTRFWNQQRWGPNWHKTNDYVFQGFIYNPAAKNITSIVPWSSGIPYGTSIQSNSTRYDGTSIDGSISLGYSGLSGRFEVPMSYATAPDHPARKFVRAAMTYAGNEEAHVWVMDRTHISKNQGWSVATICAAAKDCKFEKDVVPLKKFNPTSFGHEIDDKLGGKYYEGGLKGGVEKPQVGDVFGILHRHATTKFAADHMGIVRGVQGNTVLTVEGDINNKIGLYRRGIKDLAWFIRPDWTRVGGTAECTTLFASPLYNTSSTREDATLREVASLTDTAEPSIKETTTKLSAINYTGVLSGIYDAVGYSNLVQTASGGSSYNSYGITSNVNYTVDTSGLVSNNARIIFDFLLEKGFNAAHCVAWLANIRAESNYYPSAVNKSSGASGLCQWLGSRKDAMIVRCGPDWQNNMSGQLDFLWYELQSYQNETYQLVMSIAGNDLNAALEATDIILKKFETPGYYEINTPSRAQYCREIWNQIVSLNSGGTSSSNVSVRTRSGKTITVGETIPIPSSVKQTGIIPNFTNYNRNWSRNTNQRRLYDIWVSQGRQSNYYIATIDGYFLVATTTLMGMPGDIISVVLDDGTYFLAIIGDSKGADVSSSSYSWETGNSYGHLINGVGIDIVEWEANGSDQDSLRAGITQAGWKGKKVVKIVNFGSWLDG